MKLSRQHRRIARVILQDCIVAGIPDVTAIRRHISILLDEKNRQKEFILEALLERISLYLRENRLKISSPDDLTEKRREQILSAIGSTTKFIGGVEFFKNESLIAGLKIEKGYDIEEYSVSRQLEILRSRFLKN